jgi:hypothetical protein
MIRTALLLACLVGLALGAAHLLARGDADDSDWAGA